MVGLLCLLGLVSSFAELWLLPQPITHKESTKPKQPMEENFQAGAEINIKNIITVARSKEIKGCVNNGAR